ncbi:MAG: triple tyrosine motif-containing protein [Bacteroidales bacterium]
MTRAFYYIATFILIGITKLAIGQPTFHVTNYNKSEYQAGNQNWDISISSNRMLYVANNNGILRFNGANWQLINIPNKTIMRSVLYDSTRLYVGSFEEFGYWEIENNELTEYHSLSENIGKSISNQEFWRIVKHNGNIYFQSFGSIYKFDGKSVKSIELSFPVLFLLSTSNQLFVQEINGGLFRIVDDKLQHIPNSEIFSNTEVKVALQHENGSILFGTNNKGLFIYDGVTFKPWKTEIDKELISSNINNGIEVNNQYFLGSILNGVFVLSKNGKLINHIDSKYIQNNTVLSIDSDKLGNIWLGLDRGISYISFNTPFDIYIDKTNSESVYSGIINDNRLYIGSNQGIYYYELGSDNHFRNKKLVPNSQGQVWFIKQIDKKIYCGLNNGTYLLEDLKLKKIGNVSGGYNMTKMNAEKDYYIQNTYSQLVLYKQHEGIWKQDRTLEGFTSPSRLLEVDFQGNIWLGHSIEGILKLQPDSELKTIIKQESIGKKQGLDFKANRIYKINNRIIVPSPKGLLRWDDLKDKFVPYSELNTQLEGFETAHAIISLPNSRYWFIKNKEWGLFEIRFGKAMLLYRIIPEMYNFNLVENYENITSLNDSLELVCLDNGFALLNIFQLNRLTEINTPPTITSIQIWKENSDRNELVNQTRRKIAIPFNQNNISFSFSSNEIIGTKRYFQYKLIGIDNSWSDWQTTTTSAYNRLPKGNYKFLVRTLNSKGIVTKSSEIIFEIKPPYYQSVYAYLLYVLLLLLMSLLSWKINRNRLTKHIEHQRKLEEDRLQKEREEVEKTIIKLQNDNLQADIQYKSSQLALSTMSIVRKNELLMEIGKELTDMKGELGYRVPNKYFDKINKLINQNIDNENDWEVFEKLFDQAHQNFFKRLKDAYPSLTSSDLRLCAYLRMNLSSKEIAPLINITVRGVEERRYRLRKRLNLPTEESLTDFILKF